MEPDRSSLDKGKSAAILLNLSTGAPSCSKINLTVGKCIYISRQGVFEEALQTLGLKVHEVKACIVGNDEIIGSVCIDVPGHEQQHTLHKRKKFGDYKLTEEDALESAKLATHVYLQKAGVIVVDDINLTELNKREAELTDCHRKLLAASSWANLFQEQTEALQAELATVREENKNLLAKTKMVHVKKELTDPGSSDLKTNVIPLQTPGTRNDTCTAPPIISQTKPSMLQPEEKRVCHVTSAKRALFKKMMILKKGHDADH